MGLVEPKIVSLSISFVELFCQSKDLHNYAMKISRVLLFLFIKAKYKVLYSLRWSLFFTCKSFGTTGPSRVQVELPCVKFELASFNL